MGILDDLRSKVEKLGDRAKEGLDDAKDRAGDLLDDAKERFGGRDDETSPLAESSDVGPDTTSTDAVQPGYVTAEDDVAGPASDEDALSDDEADDVDDVDDLEDAGGTDEEDDPVAEEEAFAAEPAAASDATPTDAGPAAAELDAEELVEADDDAGVGPGTDAADGSDGAEPAPGPVVETDVDPYDEPLTETIGDEIAAALVDREAVAEAVDGTSERDAQP